MDRDDLGSLSETLTDVAGLMAELARQFHPSMGGTPDFEFFDSMLQWKGERLRVQGQPLIADGIIELRAQIGAMNNG